MSRMAPATSGHHPPSRAHITLKVTGLAHYQSRQGADTWAGAPVADKTLIGALPSEVELS